MSPSAHLRSCSDFLLVAAQNSLSFESSDEDVVVGGASLELEDPLEGRKNYRHLVLRIAWYLTAIVTKHDPRRVVQAIGSSSTCTVT